MRAKWFRTLDLHGHGSIQHLLFGQRIENACGFGGFVFKEALLNYLLNFRRAQKRCVVIFI